MTNSIAPESPRRLPLEKIERLARLMDTAFVVPGTSIRFGLDPLLGLVPAIGDTLSLAVSGYIYSFARQAGVPGRQRARMIWNIFIDWLIGLVPVLGDLFDVRFKANTRNIRIIQTYLNRQQTADDRDR